MSMDPWFSISRLSLLDRGFVYAIAHVRGGGEMGRYWYDDGKLLNKMNTFTDFIACAEHLIKENYTSKDRLVIGGGSAGGLLVGAVVNMRPDLFKVVIGKDYPNMLITAGLNDTRVQYWEPAKWTARLRAMKTDNNRLLLKTNMGAGHGGKSGRYERIEEIAFEYAFMLDILGITK